MIIILIVMILLLFFIFNQQIDPFIINIIQENDLDLYVDDINEFMNKRLKKSKPILFL